MTFSHTKFLIDSLSCGICFIHIKANLRYICRFSKIEHLAIHSFVNATTTEFR